MKNTKKKVLVGALVVSLAAIVSVGSIAWFSASDSAENKFKIASSEDQDPDKTFSVDVWELTPDGKVDPDEDPYEYPDVMPGDELEKKPYVENTGSLPQYIRAIVTFDNVAAWREIQADGDDTTKKVEPIDVLQNIYDGWTLAEDETVEKGDTISYVFYYDATLAPKAVVYLFDGVKVPDAMTQAQAVAFGEREFSINVKAQAVQTANVGDNAKAAFATVGMSIND